MRRFFAILISLLVALNFIWVRPVPAAADYSRIRVALSSMGAPVTMKINVQGSYMIKENPSIQLQQKEYTVQIVNGGLVLSDGIQTWNFGSLFTFVRSDGNLRIYNSSAGGNLNYRGDMEVRIVDGALRLVNYIDTETYLYGVVPWEMSNTWPLEALKAQAVAARTYAVKCMRPSSYYDVFDTDASQVYRGYNSNYGNAIKAVNDTCGKVLMYGSSFAGTYYSSSNGGMTEAAGNIWPENLPYSIVRDDPYDISSPINSNAYWSVAVTKFPVDAGLQNKLKERLKASLSSKGYNAEDANINILFINEIYFDPANASGRMAAGRVTVTLEAFNNAAMQTETLQESVSLTQNNIRSILNLKSLKFTIQDMGETYLINGGGWGHGIGMSQYGAHQMASLGLNSAMILDFYYPGTQLTALYNNPNEGIPDRGDDRPGETPAPTPTPIPTPEKVPYGKVLVSSTLNVRQGAGSQYGVVAKLQNNTEVVVWQQVGDWYRIQTGNIKGYVNKQYVALTHMGPVPQEGTGSPVNPVPTPDSNDPQVPPVDTAPPSDQKKIGVVTASSLNVRSGPGTKNHSVGMVVKGNKITILEKVGDWYKFTWAGKDAYLSAAYVQVQAGVPTTPSAPTAATGIVTATSLNVRSGPGTQNVKIGFLAGNSKVTILSSSNGWHKIQSGSLVGYVDARYISTQVAAQTPARGDTARRAIVTASTLYVRSGAGTNYSAIGHLVRNNQVEVLQAAGAWYKIKSGGLTGYVYGAYLKLQ